VGVCGMVFVGGSASVVDMVDDPQPKMIHLILYLL